MSDSFVSAYSFNASNYANEPKRSDAFIVNYAKPFNAETRPDLLAQNYITPTEWFYKRNHGPIPQLDRDTFRITIDGAVKKKVEISMDQLASGYEHHSLAVTLQCAGNRRDEFTRTPLGPVKGVSWSVGAIGNAVWKGVYLRDVLAPFLDATAISNGQVWHVVLQGVDGVDAVDRTTRERYQASIPLDHAMDPKRTVLLATRMNGQELNRDHGFPVRAVIPGCIGARSVKWLERITIQPSEASGFYQSLDYKLYPSQIRGWKEAEQVAAQLKPMQEMAVQCAIVSSELRGDRIALSGYALSGGDREIERVEYSCDGGLVWHNASWTYSDPALPFYNALDNAKSARWCWWRADIDSKLVGASGECEIACRACRLSRRSG